MTSFTKEVNSRLAKCPLVFDGRLANRELTFLVKEATGVYAVVDPHSWPVLQWIQPIEPG